MAAPREGIVRRAFGSATAAGSPALRLPRGARHVWAFFPLRVHPDARPRRHHVAHAARAEGHHQPRGRVVSTTLSARPLPSGRYSAEARVRGVLVGRTAIRIA